MKPVIEVENLSKAYTIGHRLLPPYHSLRDEISDFFQKPLRIFGERLAKERIWALKGVSFSVGRGDVLGIIGKNGSGKSTLLKILSRIVEPTEGQAILRGKAASLLEVGTGFHPELTGRENIYFNGSILGMSKREIEKKFSEIVEFSEIEKFLDTPVKFYSSGMYVRLAFAVAAHLEPDILIVDEVLAVGDAEFQKKCLGKMNRASQEGRTVLFVSHNMEAIQNLCTKAVLLESGRIKSIDQTSKVISEYLLGGIHQERPLSERKDREGNGRLRFGSIDFDQSQLQDGTLKILLGINKAEGRDFKDIAISIDFWNQNGAHVSNLSNWVVKNPISITGQSTKIEVKIENINLAPGVYSLNLFMASDRHNAEIFDWVFNAADMEIPPRDYYQTGLTPPVQGVVNMDYRYVVKT